MKKQQAEYKVNLIGEQDLRKLPKEELELLVAAFVKKNEIAKTQSLIFSRKNNGE